MTSAVIWYMPGWICIACTFLTEKVFKRSVAQKKLFTTHDSFCMDVLSQKEFKTYKFKTSMNRNRRNGGIRSR